MGVTAHVPVRVRIDPVLAGADLDAAVRDAIRQAAGRGLAALERETLGPRGGYARPCFQSPEFSWHGRPVDARWRQGLEAGIAEELAALTTGIAARVEQQLAAAPEVAPPDPWEWLDPERLRSGGYLVASYEGELPSPDVALWLDSAAAAAAITPPGFHADWWEWDGINYAALRSAFADVLVQRYGDAAFPSRVGFICWSRPANMFHLFFMQNVRRRTSSGGGWTVMGDGLCDFTMPDQATHFELGDGTTSSGGASIRPFGEFSIDPFATFSSSAELVAAIRRWQLETHGISAEPVAGETSETARRRLSIDNFAREGATAGSSAAGILYLFRGGGQRIAIPSARDFGINATIPILPVAAIFVGETNEGDSESTASRSGDNSGGAGTGGNGGADGGDGGAQGGGNPDALPGEGTGGEGSRIVYPMVIGGETVELDLGPFEGEPSLEQLGAMGDPLRRLIRRIAFRLAMPTGEYCGAFLIAAAQVMQGRGHGVATAAEQQPTLTRSVPAGTGNLGALDMQPEITPAIELMRHLGGTCPLISQLTRLMTDTYREPGIMNQFTGWRRGDWAGWTLDFLKEHTPAMKEAVAAIYVRTCQIMMLQLLRSSYLEICNRLDHFDEYFPIAELMINRLLHSEAQLIEMRDALMAVDAMMSPLPTVAGTVRTWREARQLLSDNLSDQALTAAALTSPGRLLEQRGNLERHDGGWRIRDPRGRLWTMNELEREIAMRHQTAVSIDPLIHQFNDIPAIAATFRDSPELARVYLHALLSEMKTNNEAITQEVMDDDMFAFESGRIEENLSEATVRGTEVKLSGIHDMAHQAIGSSFVGNHWYGAGIDWIFSVEQGKRSLTSFFETALTIVLCVACPPLGIALGIGIAAYHGHQAEEREQLYGALMDPELLMTRAEMEFDLFMADFEMALSIIPDIGAIGRGINSVSSAGARGMARSGLAGAGRAALRRVQRELLAAFAQQVRAGLVRALVTTVFIDRGMTLLLPRVLGPVLAEANRELTVLSGGSVAPRPGDLPEPPVTASDAAGLTAPDYAAMSPDEAELVRRLEEYQEGDRDERPRPLSELP